MVRGRGDDSGQMVVRIQKRGVGLDGDVATQRVVGKVPAKIGSDVDGNGAAANRTTREIEALPRINVS